MPEILNLTDLTTYDAKLKDVIDDNVKDGGCSCDTEKFIWLSKMLIVRKGITFDIQSADLTGANTKIELLGNFLDGGTNFDCGCN